MTWWWGLGWLALGFGLAVLARRLTRVRFFVERLDFQLRQWLDGVQRDQQKVSRMVEALFWDRLYRDERIPITPFMTLEEVLRAVPAARGVLEARHIQGCSTCLARGVETLLDVAVSYDLDLSALMNELLQATRPAPAAGGTEVPVIPVIRTRDPGPRS